jgi:hypothetical protein
MVAEAGGVYGTLTYPHLILPYSAYTATLHRTLGVLGAPLYTGGAIKSIYRYLSRLSM